MVNSKISTEQVVGHICDVLAENEMLRQFIAERTDKLIAQHRIDDHDEEALYYAVRDEIFQAVMCRVMVKQFYLEHTDKE